MHHFQIFVCISHPLQMCHSFTHDFIGLQESLNGLKKIVYLLLILITFHLFRINGLPATVA